MHRRRPAVYGSLDEDQDMTTKINAARARQAMLALSGFLALAVGSPPLPAYAQDGLSWEPADAEVLVGDGVRIAVRLEGPSGLIALDGSAVSEARLDMGPDGMATMAAPLRPIAPGEGESLAWETDLVMGGRWALKVTTAVPGEAEPVTGEVIFTAVDEGPAPEAPPESDARAILYYRNPMGLADVSPTPKTDSMGMDYIPVYADEMSGPAGSVRFSLDRVQRAGVVVEPVAMRTLSRTVRGAGEVMWDEDAVAHVTAKFSGFVESHDLPVTGDAVSEGQTMARAWIASPELLQKQADFLTALRRGGPDAERAADNLRLFDFPEAAIEALRESGEPLRTVDLLAPMSGVVTHRLAVHGLGFEPGEELYEIVDLSHVWVVVDVSEQDMGLLREGQPVMLAFRGLTEPVGGAIAFLYPTLDRITRTGSARIVLDNADGALRPGMYAEAHIEAAATAGPVIAIPRTAIIDDGSRQVAFVAKDGGLFEPRDLVLGARGDDYVEVREGLAEGEQVVVAGTFLIDAESNLQSALAAFMTAEDPS
jgi:Cu(I)/Ag(I) efflux system membrane fusion protein